MNKERLFLTALLLAIFLSFIFTFSLTQALSEDGSIPQGNVNAEFDKQRQQILEQQQQIAKDSQEVKSASAGIFLFAGIFGIVILIIVILSFIFFIWAVINIVQAKNETSWKILWILICLFLGIVGVIIYYFVGKKQRKS